MKQQPKQFTFKLHISQSQASQIIELENLNTQESIKFSSWKYLTTYLEAKSQQPKKGLR